MSKMVSWFTVELRIEESCDLNLLSIYISPENKFSSNTFCLVYSVIVAICPNEDSSAQ